MTKNGMQGFAAGVLFSCAVIAFFFYFVFDYSGQNKSSKEKPLTAASVTQYLSSHRRVAVSEDDYQKWQNDLQAKSANANQKNTSQKNNKKEKAVNQIVLHIASGMSTKDIADQLIDNHIIKDKNAFYKYFSSHILNNTFSLANSNSIVICLFRKSPKSSQRIDKKNPLQASAADFFIAKPFLGNLWRPRGCPRLFIVIQRSSFKNKRPENLTPVFCSLRHFV
ncbi:hypothetical protein QS257_08985 [Terrilactibacillus sp. S3-3]|nr:hypothetical protein QS257_08985 [Terrilactibacillus sp. S3-3]